jgi:CCR4-NOT transcription complex subunit 7/8
MNVWDDNLEAEIDKIMQLVDKYNYIAMDTEFPGICMTGEHLIGYQFIKSNVDELKLIQVGITLSDENGETPKPISTWQFNLKFDLEQDNHAKDSINLLKEAGIDFDQLNARGIQETRLADLLLSSGLILNEDTHWITFHGAFDFGYLIRMITNNKLPSTLDKFHQSLKLYFPSVYDLKIMIQEVSELKNGSLAKLSHDLDVKRSGMQHQAGSDALLTLECFFKIKSTYFKNGVPRKASNRIFGLNAEYNQPFTPTTQNQPSFDRQPVVNTPQPTYQNVYFAQGPANSFFTYPMDVQNYYMTQFEAPVMPMFTPTANIGMMGMQSPYKLAKQ